MLHVPVTQKAELSASQERALQDNHYPDIWRGFDKPNDSSHAIFKALAAELSQNGRQDCMVVACQKVLLHTLTCTDQQQHQPRCTLTRQEMLGPKLV